jgi:hypothetical protein
MMARRKKPKHDVPERVAKSLDLSSGEVVATSVFCHNGHQLIDETMEISGHPAIHVEVEYEGRILDAYLSAIGGDHSKYVSPNVSIEPGVRTPIRCPVCHEQLPPVAPCSSDCGGDYIALFLTPDADFKYIIGICDVSGCPSAFVKTFHSIIRHFSD